MSKHSHCKDCSDKREKKVHLFEGDVVLPCNACRRGEWMAAMDYLHKGIKLGKSAEKRRRKKEHHDGTH